MKRGGKRGMTWEAQHQAGWIPSASWFQPARHPRKADEGKVSGSQSGPCTGDHEYERERKVLIIFH